MRRDVTVAADTREAFGKNEARRLRSRGFVPAIVYGAGQQPVAVSLDPKQITKILHSSTGHNTIFNIDIRGGETAPVMIVDWQYNPVKEDLLHVDLKRINLAQRIRVSVPVHTEGDPKGVKQQGGLLEIVTREIEIECLPDDIPEHFVVDVVELFIGQSVRGGDIPMTGSMKLLSHADTVIAHVVALRAHEAAPVEAAAEVAEAEPTAEPEVIKKGKQEEE